MSLLTNFYKGKMVETGCRQTWENILIQSVEIEYFLMH